MDTKKLVKKTRWYRRLHRWIASALFLFFLVMGGTGLLLGWKKHSGGYLLAETQKGSSRLPSDWLPIDSLATKAIRALKTKEPGSTPVIDRMDVRPKQGIVKVIFEKGYQAVQLDAATGDVLLYETRRSDFIEHLHDGTILDKLTGLTGGWLKLSYTTVLGLALLLLTVSGFWLWYNPRRLRKKKRAVRL
ncbi:MAG TPA: PepSY domain-containing protein [Lacibacter sp.]|nr:PepSY domain-containing protein [Lacibacter sp.]HMO88716.1 PepSY domain-containing protein [Lacibacter sp.]HMP88303.1 PepSY domain-containing protein [Lacibacter sp.]